METPEYNVAENVEAAAGLSDYFLKLYRFLGNAIMLKDIIEARPLPNLRLWIRFEDGVEGIIAVAEHVRLDGVFAPLPDPAEFACVRVNTELGWVEWPSGADLDPDVLYALLTNFDAIKELQRQHF